VTTTSESVTSESVTVIGLGLMGRALAQALVDAGLDVTVWNRTPRPEVVPGARHAATLDDALKASQLVIVCVINADTVLKLFDKAAGALAGRTIVNLTTSLPEQATVVASRAAELGADYLDGIIPAYPDGVGAPETGLIYAGNHELWRRHEVTLRHLGGESWWAGESIGAPAALDIGAVVAFYHVAFAGFIEAAAYVRQHGVSLADLLKVAVPLTGVLVESIELAARQIDTGDYSTDQATVEVHQAALDLSIEGMAPLGKLLLPVAEMLAQATTGGDGQEGFAATFKHLPITS
jgi:3-hydroxyisobutyrate dehydrogenase-like beta-hydroxyacid dehydrogenase